MIEPEAIQKFWPPLVKETLLVSEHPGYRHIFFETYEELNEYFTELCGPDWKEQEWCKFWLQQHKNTKKAYQKELEVRRGNVSVETIRPRLDEKEVLDILRTLTQSDGVKLSIRGIRKELHSRGYDVSVGSVWYYVQRIKREAAYEK